MKKRTAYTFEIPAELYAGIEGFEKAKIVCRYPNIVERSAIMEGLAKIGNKDMVTIAIALMVLGITIESITGVVYEDGEEAKLEVANSSLVPYPVLGGDIADALVESGKGVEIVRYILDQIKTGAEQKKS